MQYLLFSLVTASISTGIVVLGYEIHRYVAANYDSGWLLAGFFVLYALAAFALNFASNLVIVRLIGKSGDSAYAAAGESRALFSWAASLVLFFIFMGVGSGCYGSVTSKKIETHGIRELAELDDLKDTERAYVTIANVQSRTDMAIRGSFKVTHKSGGGTRIVQVLVPVLSRSGASTTALFAYASESKEKELMRLLKDTRRISGALIRDEDSRCFGMLQGFDFEKARLTHIVHKLCFEVIDGSAEGVERIHRQAGLFFAICIVLHFAAMVFFVGLKKPAAE